MCGARFRPTLPPRSPDAYRTIPGAPSPLPGGVTGWASAPYLVTSAAGTPKNLQVVGAQLGIPVVMPANTGAPVVATPPVGAMVPVAPTVGVVQPVAPPPTV